MAVDVVKTVVVKPLASQAVVVEHEPVVVVAVFEPLTFSITVEVQSSAVTGEHLDVVNTVVVESFTPQPVVGLHVTALAVVVVLPLPSTPNVTKSVQIEAVAVEHTELVELGVGVGVELGVAEPKHVA